MEIGAGITIGGGITLEVPSGGGGGGGGGDITGTMTVGFNDTLGNRYGYQGGFPGPYGSTSTTPSSIISSFYTTTSFTAIRFAGGTYGSITVDGMTGLIDGHSSLSIDVDGTTVTLATGGPAGGGYSVSNDVFSLASKNGTTVNIAITLL